MNPFVGYQKQPLSVPQLLQLIQELVADNPSYYFLRWSHAVSGIIKQPPTEAQFPMLEGQMFNYLSELRWKPQGEAGYQVLLLTIAGEHGDFTPMKAGKQGEGETKLWRIEPNNPQTFPAYGYRAHLYRRDATRFPKELTFDHQPQLAQRYFIDSETSSVQFVALTLEVAPT
jgi:hypothetical protein